MKFVSCEVWTTAGMDVLDIYLTPKQKYNSKVLSWKLINPTLNSSGCEDPEQIPYPRSILAMLAMLAILAEASAFTAAPRWSNVDAEPLSAALALSAAAKPSS